MINQQKLRLFLLDNINLIKITYISKDTKISRTTLSLFINHNVQLSLKNAEILKNSLKNIKKKFSKL